MAQPLRLDIKRQLSARSDRVKCVDMHPVEPWMLSALYNGTVQVWNYDTQTMIKTFEVTDLPVRAAKFVQRKNWVVTGSVSPPAPAPARGSCPHRFDGNPSAMYMASACSLHPSRSLFQR